MLTSGLDGGVLFVQEVISRGGDPGGETVLCETGGGDEALPWHLEEVRTVCNCCFKCSLIEQNDHMETRALHMATHLVLIIKDVRWIISDQASSLSHIAPSLTKYQKKNVCS